MIGAVCTSMGFFGAQTSRFSSVNNTVMTLFQLVFGGSFYDDMETANPMLAPVFLYLFIIVFYFIVMKFF
jgi:hypothetical protein